MADVKRAGLYLLICLVLCHGFVAALNCSSPTPEGLGAALEKELFPKNILRPVKRFSDPINVSLDFTVAGIIGVDEKSQSMTTFLWQTLEWDIEGFSWDEKECGTTRISVPREKLWIPDIIIEQFMDEDKSPKTPYVYLFNTGRVLEAKPVRAVSSCRLEIYDFPFDHQNCSLTFGSYLLYAGDLKMIQKTTAADILKESNSVLLTKGEWDLKDIIVSRATLEISSGNYSQITYNIILRRKPVLYVVNLLLPSLFLVTLDILSFLLPPHSVDRSAFKITLILGYTVFLLLMNDMLPVSGNTTPLLNAFFLVTLALMVASLLETLYITNLQFSPRRFTPVPHWLEVTVLQYGATLVCLPPKKKSNRVTVALPQSDIAVNTISVKDCQSMYEDISHEKPCSDPLMDELRKMSRDLTVIRQEMEKQYEGTDTSQDWEMVGRVIDRMLFWLYVAFMVVTIIVLAAIFVAWSNI